MTFLEVGEVKMEYFLVKMLTIDYLLAEISQRRLNYSFITNESPILCSIDNHLFRPYKILIKQIITHFFKGFC